MCFVDIEKAFVRVPSKVLELEMRKKGIPEVFVRSVMSLYAGARTSIKVYSELSEEFEIKVGMHQGSVLSPFLFVVVIDVVTELAREGVLSELLYADDLVLMREAVTALRDMFLKWKEAFESKCLKVSHGKTKVIVSCSLTKGGLSKSKVESCGICRLRVKVSTFVCVQCSK